MNPLTYRLLTGLMFVMASGLCGSPGTGSQAAPAGAAEPAIRVLIVTGMDHPAHDWRTTTPALQKELARDRRIGSTVLTDPYQLDRTDLTAVDVVLLHFCNWQQPDPNEQARANLQTFVRQGGGLVVLHFASGAFEHWPEFAKLAGKVWDRKTTHDPRGAFRVTITEPEHPITRGLQAFTADDELYFCLTGEQPVRVLAVARSQVTGTLQPMAFTLSYGKGRVFHTPLGHDARAIHVPAVAELLRRGVAWSAGKHAVPDDEQPEQSRSPSIRTSP